MNELDAGKIHIALLEKGSDLLLELNKIVKKKNIRAGHFQVNGIVSKAVFGSRLTYSGHLYDNYKYNEIKEKMLILSCTGNISIKEDEPFVHAHIMLGNFNKEVFGGHMGEGTEVFTAEVIIQEFIGEEIVRKKDRKTGLFLW